jgi:CheY-like chemotaxis protein/two-component sensor histidine kinase
MEAIGQLAGGVAHDFNNILAVIISIGYLLELQLKGNTAATEYVSEIMNAADKAATLTQSLLAFSRKQQINPQPMDLNAAIQNAERILARTIGEDIQLILQLTEQNTTLNADSSQMTQILINLATNARDAMPKGGALTIRTEHALIDEAFVEMQGYGGIGDYVLMTVTDSGKGMDSATRHRAFEPFFTTKEVGKGTGLGLSMVYGIVEQHGGFIKVYSERGTGTAFKVYLPALEGKAEEKQSNEHFKPEGATETILLVEDDTNLRLAMTKLLERFGYTVIEAVDGNDAITNFIANRDKIQLVLMDVIMPNKGGGDAYQELKIIKPEIKIILMSGYAGDFLSEKLRMEADVHFISKPVLPKHLFEIIKTVLHG